MSVHRVMSYVLQDSISQKVKRGRGAVMEIRGCFSDGGVERDMRKLSGRCKCYSYSGDGYMVCAFVRTRGMLHLSKFYLDKNTEWNWFIACEGMERRSVSKLMYLFIMCSLKICVSYQIL